MPKPLRPQDVAIMREALEYQAEPLDAEDFAVMLSNNISNPFSEEQPNSFCKRSALSKPIPHLVYRCPMRIKRSSCMRCVT